MRIKGLYLKNFGKFSDKKIEVQEGINIFYGENESGKTTIHTFIKAMLFGLERGRGRASVNDTFSLYEPWENSNFYSGVLRFQCGGKNFCLTRTFDKYTKSATLFCEDDGEEFSLEHGDLEMLLEGLNAQNYENTVAIGQMKIETNQNLAVELQNFATNYYATGNSDIDLDGALTHIGKKRKETERQIKVLEQEKEKHRYDLEQEKSYVWRDMRELEEQIEELDGAIEGQMETKEEIEEQDVKKWRVHPGEIIGVIVGLILLAIIIPDPLGYLVAIVLGLWEGIRVWNRLKDGKKRPQEEVLQEANEELQKLLWKKQHIQEEWKEKSVMYGNLEEELSELGNAGEEYQQLLQTQKALAFAEEKLMLLSKDVHKELSANLNQKASAILSEITGGKYEMLLVDEKLKMHLFSDGRRISLEQVSRGTIEQIYFSLRMAASEILFQEEYPIILDDTFVYYDDIRLEHTLRWLKNHKKQVLIFTCQKREQEILKRIS